MGWLIGVVCSGCLSLTSKVVGLQSSHREGDGSTIEVMSPDPLSCQSFLDDDQLAFAYSRVRTQFGRSTYEIDVVNIGSGRLVISDGESLVFYLDGRRVGYRGEGSHEYLPTSNRTYVVSAAYSVTFADLKEITEAYSAKVTIRGNDRYIERCLDAGDMENLKKFMELCPPR